MIPIALTIAGFDPSGGAGIQADLKSFHQRGVYGLSVATMITIQNTLGVKEIFCLEAGQVRKQLETLLEDIQPQAIKTGALGHREVVEVVADFAREFKVPLVVDPVMRSKNGY